MRVTCLECLGLLTSESASIKAFSRSGLSAMWRFIIAPAVVFPRLSQLAGTSFQVCLTRISSQCVAAVAKAVSSTAVRKDNTESQWYHMNTGVSAGKPRMFRKSEVYLSIGALRTWLRCGFFCGTSSGESRYLRLQWSERRAP